MTPTAPNGEFPRLNFPNIPELRISYDDKGVLWIRDGLRRAWLRLLPEEWVRQHLIWYLIEKCGAPAARIAQECPVALGGMRQRADVVVYGADGRPLLLAECKASEVEDYGEALAQAVRYNSVLGARYVVVTNGMRHFIRELRPDGSYVALEGFPALG